MGRLLVAQFCAFVVGGLELFEFGPEAGDESIPRTDDECNSNITVSHPIVFNGSKTPNIFVCPNGVISLEEASNGRFSSTSLIAPLGSDVDLRDSFMIYPLLNVSSDDIDFSDWTYLDEDTEVTLKRWIDSDTWNSIKDDNEKAQLIFTRLQEDSNLKVELTNNVFYRQTTDKPTLEKIQYFLSKHAMFEEPVWAMVATWYYVAPYPLRRDAFNTFQVILVSSVEKRLIIIFIYDSIQWTRYDLIQFSYYAQASFGDGKGNVYMLPGSRCPEVRNLQWTSNVNDPGTWVFILDENDGVSCPNYAASISPDSSRLIGGHTFNISGICGIKNYDSIEVRFTGSRRMVSVPGILTKNGAVQARFPYWGRSEKVAVDLLINHTSRAYFNVRFYSLLERLPNFKEANETENSNVRIKRLRRPDGSQVIVAQWNSKEISQYNEVKIKLVKVKTETVAISEEEAGDFKFEVISVLKKRNDGSVEFEDPSGDDGDLLHVVVMSYNCDINEFGLGFHSSSCGGILSSDGIPMSTLTDRKASCLAWLEHEKTRGTDWHGKVQKWYGCPRYLSKFSRYQSDAWFARREVERGFRGWQYDECCMENPPEYIKTLGVCENCGRNNGAQFCIRSIQLRVYDKTNAPFDSSNKCCYDSNGALITDVLKGAGTVDKRFLRFDIESYQDDVKPYEDCCDNSSKLCSKYHQFRPALIGEYFSLNIRILYGDPHLETLDGVKYTFNGFGVYQLLLSGDGTLNVQASTRVKEKGTVFSGISIKQDISRAEIFLLGSGDFKITVNDAAVDPYSFPVSSIGSVMVMIKKNSTEFVFIFSNGLSVKAMVKANILNFGLSVPPTMKRQLSGLLGNFDDNPDNDFISRDGEMLPISLAESEQGMSKLHESFGQSWRIKRSDWLFSSSTSSQIDSELRRDAEYSAVYVTQFENDLAKEVAEKECSEAADAQACLLDVVLTQDVSIARVSREIAPDLEAAEVLTEISSISVYPVENSGERVQIVSRGVAEEWSFLRTILVSSLACIVFIVGFVTLISIVK